MIYLIIERGGGGSNISAGVMFQLYCGKLKGYYNSVLNYTLPRNMYATSSGTAIFGVQLTRYNNGFVVRANEASGGSAALTYVEIGLSGNFNYDELRILNFENFSRRVEVRNEDGVLITDNGLPRADGTYPPDAKNRAGLTGLHAAPIASNNEFADLSGLDPNKEVEMIGGERGEGMQYALERNDDNGL